MFDDGDAASHLWLEPTMSGKGSRHRYYPEPPSAILQLPTTHTHLFSGPFSRTTRVSRYQKGKPIWILLKQETVSGSGISWAMASAGPCASPHLAPDNMVCYRVTVTVTGVSVLHPLLGKQGHITKQSSVCIPLSTG